MLQGFGPGDDPNNPSDYGNLVSDVCHDLDSLEYNVYFTWMHETKKKLGKMIIPALIESQSLATFATEGNQRSFNRYIPGMNNQSQPAYSMDDMLNLLTKVWKNLKIYQVEKSVVRQVFAELLLQIGVTSFNHLLLRRNFSSWKRGKCVTVRYQGCWLTSIAQ